MRDLFIEIWESVRRNKLRTCLTGFAVSWGIFMLIVLLGAGNGLMHAFMSSGDSIATNVMMAGGGMTSKPYAGYKSSRWIWMKERDIELTKSFKDVVDDVAPTRSISTIVSKGDKYASCNLEGNVPVRQSMDKIPVLHGRFINDNDIENNRKIVVLPDNVAEQLSGGRAIETLLGQLVKIEGINFRVVGISEHNVREGRNILYAPYTTMSMIWNKGDYIDMLRFTFHGLKSKKDNAAFEKSYKASLNLSHSAAPDDESATWIYNTYTQNLQMNTASGAIKIALWIIGIFTLLSGIVGVSNIMLITVKERTHEFGIRKAIGARPGNITKLIVSESICITAIFGYIGMVLGLIACEVLDKTVGNSSLSVLGSNMVLFKDPFVGVDVAIEATILLIVAGTISGLVPALKAAKVRPIEALRKV